MRRKFLKALQVLVSLSLLAFLISRTDIKAILSIVSSSNLLFLAVAFLIYVSTVFIISYRWYILLQAQEVNLPLRKLVLLYFIGFFFNNFLPTSVGGDLYRAYGAAKQSGKRAVSLASVFTERLMGFLAITVMVLFSLIFIAPAMDGYYVLILSLLFLFLLLFLLLIFLNRRFFLYLTQILGKIKTMGIGEKLVHFSESVNVYCRYSRALLKVFVVSLCYQLFMVLFSYSVSQALGLGLSVFDFILFVPVIGLISMFPLSVNGIGIREAGYIFLLSRVGRGSSEALSLSLMIYAIGVAASLIGGALFGLQRMEGKGEGAFRTNSLSLLAKSGTGDTKPDVVAKRFARENRSEEK